jgi:hypothetical protein
MTQIFVGGNRFYLSRLNLVESHGDLYLPAGKSAGKSGERWLHQDKIAEEEQRLHMALPYFFAKKD